MPIVRIEALVRTPPDVEALLRATARAVASALGSDERHCWATFRALEPGSYLEGGRLRTAEEAQEVSPLVTILAAHGRSGEQKAAALRAVAAAVGQGLGSDPANVFVEYRELPPGHVHAGGEVR